MWRKNEHANNLKSKREGKDFILIKDSICIRNDNRKKGKFNTFLN